MGAGDKPQSRKDPKGRVLRKGEGYREDKHLYIFQYTDPTGKSITLYAEDLKELRRKEDIAAADRLDNIQSYVAGKMTLNYAFDRYMSLKYNLKQSTRANYLYLYDRFVRRTIGKRLLKDIRYSDVKYYYYQLINKEGLKPITVDNIQTLIHPVFSMGVRDGVIRQNPASGVMTEIKKSNLWDKGTGVRHALTVDQGKAFLDYVKQSKTYNHWLPLFLCFFCTGMRVGEVCGLTWDDVDFEKREISVNHALVYRKIDDSMKYYISRPKSEAGIRVVPIMNQLYTELEALYQLQKMRGFNATSLDGLTKFIFVTQRGGFYQQGTINKAISRILNEYNDQERLKAAREGRNPLLLPHFSCHYIRHTFCTRLCENEQNIKAIQEIMGHKDIQTTLNIYAEATNTVKHEAIESLQKGWSIF